MDAYWVNPLDLPGPQFLGFYVFVMISTAIVAHLLKRAIVSSGWPDARNIMMVDPYEAAYLRGGARQAVDAAIAMLAQKQVIDASKTSRTIWTKAPLPAGAHPFEKAVHQAIGPQPGQAINAIRTSARLKPYTNQLAARLQSYGFVPSDNRWQAARMVSGLLMLMVLLLGIAKIYVGTSRHRPVGFLVFLCIIAAVITLVMFNSRPQRTRWGNQALKQFQGESAALQMAARTQPNLLASGDIALAIGLFGIDALAFADDSWTNLKATLQPPPATGSSSSGSGCSSSSCGSSCGGGCGGGCGGCGGG